jgi:RES domain-containing protein
VLPESELRNAILGLGLITVYGPWIRAIRNKYLMVENPRPLWSEGSIRHGARFVPKGGFPSIHLTSDPVTAFLEVEAVFRSTGGDLFSVAKAPWTPVRVEGVVESVLDLADPQVWDRLGTNRSELTGDWRWSQDCYLRGDEPVPPTQLLGKVAYATVRVCGILYPSAKNPGRGVNLVVFPDRLHPDGTSHLQALAHRIP